MIVDCDDSRTQSVPTLVLSLLLDSKSREIDVLLIPL